jgi:hypothetical protein
VANHPKPLVQPSDTDLRLMNAINAPVNFSLRERVVHKGTIYSVTEDFVQDESVNDNGSARNQQTNLFF